MATPSLQQKVSEFPAMDQEIQEVQDNPIEDLSMEDEEVNSRKDMITTTLDFKDFKSVSLEKKGTLPIHNGNTKLNFEDLLNRDKEEEKAGKKCQRVAKDFVDLLGTTKEIIVDDMVGDFLVVEEAEELVLILVEENEGSISKELEMLAEQQDVSFIR